MNTTLNKLYWLKYKEKNSRKWSIYSSRRYKNTYPTRALIVAVGDKVKLRKVKPIRGKNRYGKQEIKRFQPYWIEAYINNITSTRNDGWFLEVVYYKYGKRKKNKEYVDLNTVNARYVERGAKTIYVLPRRYLDLEKYTNRNIRKKQLEVGKKVCFYHKTNRRWIFSKVVAPYLPPPGP